LSEFVLLRRNHADFGGLRLGFFWWCGVYAKENVQLALMKYTFYAIKNIVVAKDLFESCLALLLIAHLASSQFVSGIAPPRVARKEYCDK
jgi:hypothetical protein